VTHPLADRRRAAARTRAEALQRRALVDVHGEDDEIVAVPVPVATLWGANAMNGVINIITRATYLTNGAVATAVGGNAVQEITGRYGGKLGNDTSFRVDGMATSHGSLELSDGSSAHDRWYKTQGGFRSDWSREADTFTFQGDAYRATEMQLGTADQQLSGANALTRWRHHVGQSDLSIQAYVDQHSAQPPRTAARSCCTRTTCRSSKTPCSVLSSASSGAREGALIATR